MRQKIWLLPVILLIVALFSCVSQVYALPPSSPIVTESSNLISQSELQVIVFDVGQADCILLMTDGHSMLIDAGNIGQGKLIINYLDSYGVKKLDYLVATHPHSDHIGAMASVILMMESIGKVIMPDVTHNTKTFESMIAAIENRGIPIAIAVPGAKFSLGDAEVQVLAPKVAKYKDLNDYSVVLRVKYGETVFLFTGDADLQSEIEQKASRLPLTADVIKVGHHGSRTSSSQEYLETVTPKLAVISLGKDNTYGHPHTQTMDRFTDMNLEVYRTDLHGSIRFVTDGKVILINPERGSKSLLQPGAMQQNLFIGNKNSKVFHKSSCKTLPQEQNRVSFTSKNAATKANYTPCNSCKP
jgi:competence protein ComEC